MATTYITKEGIDEWLKESFREYAAHHGNGYNKSLKMVRLAALVLSGICMNRNR